MSLIEDLLKQQQQEPVAQQSNWVQNLIDQRYQPKTERLKRAPVGFDFKREPFDPSSFYKSLELNKAISTAATDVVNVQMANRQAKEQQVDFEKALRGVHPNFTGGGFGEVAGNAGKDMGYRLGKVTSTTAKAANYFGGKYGIKTIGGWREHGSVPGSDHPKGRGLDYMINNIKNGKKVGTALANDAVANYKKWNIKYVIWNRYIWQPGRGWKKYSGPSPHTDHVHISFNK